MTSKGNYYAGLPSLRQLLEAVPRKWTSIHRIVGTIAWYPRGEFLARQRDHRNGGAFNATPIVLRELNHYSGVHRMAKTADQRPQYFERRRKRGRFGEVYEFRLTARGAQRLQKYRDADGKTRTDGDGRKSGLPRPKAAETALGWRDPRESSGQPRTCDL